MSKTQRNLDIYYRVIRDGEYICYSHMTATERQDVIYERMGREDPEKQAWCDVRVTDSTSPQPGVERNDG